MLSLQEIGEKYGKPLRKIEELVTVSRRFHPQDMLEKGELTNIEYEELRQAAAPIPLREFMAKSGTAGIGGAYYLAAVKTHDLLINYAAETDKVPILSRLLVEKWEGGDLTIAVADDGSFVPTPASSGGKGVEQEAKFMNPTITPDPTYVLAPHIGDDLVEDAVRGVQGDVLEWHLAQAAQACGRKATNLALAVLMTAADGWGDINTAATGDGGITKWTGATTMDILDAIDENSIDGWISNTIITSGTSWQDQIARTLPTGSTYLPVKQGFTHCVNDMDILLHNSASTLTNSSSKLVTIVLDRVNALITGRKRWLQLENYKDPIRGLAGAVITFRQDSVTFNDDAICRITET